MNGEKNLQVSRVLLTIAFILLITLPTIQPLLIAGPRNPKGLSLVARVESEYLKYTDKGAWLPVNAPARLVIAISSPDATREKYWETEQIVGRETVKLVSGDKRENIQHYRWWKS